MVVRLGCNACDEFVSVQKLPRQPQAASRPRAGADSFVVGGQGQMGEGAQHRHGRGRQGLRMGACLFAPGGGRSRMPATGTGARNARSRASRSLPSGTPSLKFCWKSTADRAIRRAVVTPIWLRQEVRQGTIEFALPQASGRQPGSMPLFVKAAAAAGAVMNLTSALAASASFAPAMMPLENVVNCWMSAGNGPT